MAVQPGAVCGSEVVATQVPAAVPEAEAGTGPVMNQLQL